MGSRDLPVASSDCVYYVYICVCVCTRIGRRVDQKTKDGRQKTIGQDRSVQRAIGTGC